MLLLYKNAYVTVATLQVTRVYCFTQKNGSLKNAYATSLKRTATSLKRTCHYLVNAGFRVGPNQRPAPSQPTINS